MSADFWAGYISGALGIVVGNPLDVLKVRLQAKKSASADINARFRNTTALATGVAAPILGYGALNALLFVCYNRSESALRRVFPSQGELLLTWVAGAVGGLATWVVSTPTELVKCRAQMATPPLSSWTIARNIWRERGVSGLYLGGTVTALRDSIGYGFYFWSYALSTQWWTAIQKQHTNHDRNEDGNHSLVFGSKSCKVLICGGVAGVATWLTVFPLDVVKTRVQVQSHDVGQERFGTLQITKRAFKQEGTGVFFRGLTICSLRAFIVNAVQWTIYEWMMKENEF